LAADDAPNARLLADGGRVVDGNACHKRVKLETAISPKTVGGEIPKEDNTDGK
jgi:hypothetical protein